jgi:hypothetical protein
LWKNAGVRLSEKEEKKEFSKEPTLFKKHPSPRISPDTIIAKIKPALPGTL